MKRPILSCSGAACVFALTTHVAFAGDAFEAPPASEAYRSHIVYAPPLASNVDYRAYPLPTTSSVIYNRPILSPGWPARSCFGYYLALARCSCN